MENDYELLYLAKENNEYAIELLYQKYYSILYTKAKKYSRNNSVFLDDYLNIAIYTFYNTIDNYKDDTNFSTYLNSCLDNALLNYQKSLTRNKNKILNEALTIDDENTRALDIISDRRYNPETILFNNLNYEYLKEKIIQKLTWKEELVFTLKIQNYSPKEISQITDNNIKSIYHIIKRLQTKILQIMSN